jgi:hypothetical protein
MATCTVKVDVLLTDVGNETQKSIRYTTTNTPEVYAQGYGTIAAADTYEALPLGQVDPQQIDLVYLKSIDNTIYAQIMTSVAQTDHANIVLNASEATIFQPSNTLGVGTAGAVSIYIQSGTAEAKYEYIVIGQSS